MKTHTEDKFWGSLLVASFGISLFLSGCGDTATDLVSQATGSTESTEIQASVDDSQYKSLFESEAATEEDVEDGLQKATEAASTTVPVRWHREKTAVTRTVDVHLEAGRANAAMTLNYTGNFVLDLNGDTLFGVKPITAIGRRYADFAVNNSEDLAIRRRSLVAISPAEFSLGDSTQQTIQIREVKAVVGGAVRMQITDPSVKLAFPSGLPTFATGEVMLLTATVENKNADGTNRPSRVYIHWGKKRALMYDDGTHGDVTAGDNIFSKEITVDGNNVGHHHSEIDAIDGAVFADETTPNYNSEIWGVPMIIE